MDMDIIDYYNKNNLEIQLYIDEIESIKAEGKSKIPILENRLNNQKRTLTTN